MLIRVLVDQTMFQVIPSKWKINESKKSTLKQITARYRNVVFIYLIVMISCSIWKCNIHRQVKYDFLLYIFIKTCTYLFLNFSKHKVNWTSNYYCYCPIKQYGTNSNIVDWYNVNRLWSHNRMCMCTIFIASQNLQLSVVTIKIFLDVALHFAYWTSKHGVYL